MLLGQIARNVLNELTGFDTILGLDLYGDLAGDILEPGFGRLIDHVDSTRRQASEEAHDGDDQCQRTAGDGASRNDRSLDLLATLSVGPRGRHDLGTLVRPQVRQSG